MKGKRRERNRIKDGEKGGGSIKVGLHKEKIRNLNLLSEIFFKLELEQKL